MTLGKKLKNRRTTGKIRKIASVIKIFGLLGPYKVTGRDFVVKLIQKGWSIEVDAKKEVKQSRIMYDHYSRRTSFDLPLYLPKPNHQYWSDNKGN
jgi:hypothetical protein